MPELSPCDSAVSCLDVDACVSDITPHNVVGEVGLQDVEVGIDSYLENIINKSVWAELQAGRDIKHHVTKRKL